MTDSRRPAPRGGRRLARAFGSLVDVFPSSRVEPAADPFTAALAVVLNDFAVAAEREISAEWPRVAGRLGGALEAASPAPTSPAVARPPFSAGEPDAAGGPPFSAGEPDAAGRSPFSAGEPDAAGSARPRDLGESDAFRILPGPRQRPPRDEEVAWPDDREPTGGFAAPVRRSRQTAAVQLGPGGWRYLVDLLGDVLWSAIAAWQVPPGVAATVVRLAWAEVLDRREFVDDDAEAAIRLLEAVRSGAIQQILQAESAWSEPARAGDDLPDSVAWERYAMQVSIVWQEYFLQYSGTGSMPDKNEIHQHLIALVRGSYLDPDQDRTLFRDMLDPPPLPVREAQHQVMAGIAT